MSIGKHTQHDVVSGGVMDEGPLGVDEEDVRHPDLFDQAAVEGHALVRGAGERQTLVLPIVSQVQGHGEVLCKKWCRIYVVCFGQCVVFPPTLKVHTSAQQQWRLLCKAWHDWEWLGIQHFDRKWAKTLPEVAQNTTGSGPEHYPNWQC